MSRISKEVIGKKKKKEEESGTIPFQEYITESVSKGKMGFKKINRICN